MVQNLNFNAHRLPIKYSKLLKIMSEDIRRSRTAEKQKLEIISLESLWRRKLSTLGWAPTSAKRLIMHWAPTTMNTYNKSLEKLALFCIERFENFPFVSEKTLADYFCKLTASTVRPRSSLTLTSAALACLSEAIGIPHLVSSNLQKLISALIKSDTQEPMYRSKVMPVENFKKLFLR